jgi:Rrf2 family transcriptional regulator, iron-sulfur cluster assembly transcription factor
MRLELARRTDLALRALQKLCTSDARVAGTALAEDLATTHQYLPQIMSPLVRRRWVTSSRGPRGGYRLEVGLDTISVLELIETMEGPTDIDTCVLSGATCDASDPCAMHVAWSQARDALLLELSSMSLADASNEC